MGGGRAGRFWSRYLPLGLFKETRLQRKYTRFFYKKVSYAPSTRFFYKKVSYAPITRLS